MRFYTISNRYMKNHRDLYLKTSFFSRIVLYRFLDKQRGNFPLLRIETYGLHLKFNTHSSLIAVLKQ